MYQIIDGNGNIIYEFQDMSFLLFSEIFTFTERQLFRESYQSKTPVSSGKYKGYSLIKINSK